MATRKTAGDGKTGGRVKSKGIKKAKKKAAKKKK